MRCQTMRLSRITFCIEGHIRSFTDGTLSPQTLSLTHGYTPKLTPSHYPHAYAADWTVAQLREPTQEVANRLQALLHEAPAQ